MLGAFDFDDVKRKVGYFRDLPDNGPLLKKHPTACGVYTYEFRPLPPALVCNSLNMAQQFVEILNDVKLETSTTTDEKIMRFYRTMFLIDYFSIDFSLAFPKSKWATFDPRVAWSRYIKALGMPTFLFRPLLWECEIRFALLVLPDRFSDQKDDITWAIASRAQHDDLDRLYSLIDEGLLNPVYVINQLCSEQSIHPLASKLDEHIVPLSSTNIHSLGVSSETFHDAMSHLIDLEEAIPTEPDADLAISGSVVLWELLGRPASWKPKDVDVYYRVTSSNDRPKCAVKFADIEDTWITQLSANVHAKINGWTYDFIPIFSAHQKPMNTVINDYDMSCVRFVYTDRTIYASVSAMRAFVTKTTKIYEHNGDRIEKYIARGFKVGSFEPNAELATRGERRNGSFPQRAFEQIMNITFRDTYTEWLYDLVRDIPFKTNVQVESEITEDSPQESQPFTEPTQPTEFVDESQQ